MNTFAVVFLCIQACLVQNVFGLCGCGMGRIPATPITGIAPSACGTSLSSAAYSPASFSYAPTSAYSPTIGSGYGGIGEGNVAVIGELPIVGNTAVGGQVPIIGIVSFSGAVPAVGAVSISAQSTGCGCSCIY